MTNGTLIGESPLFRYVMMGIEDAAPNDIRVLLEGETGVGKELFATEIHQRSSRKDKAPVHAEYNARGAGTSKFCSVSKFRHSIVLNIINNGKRMDCKIAWNNKIIIQYLQAHSITTMKWNGSLENHWHFFQKRFLIMIKNLITYSTIL